MACPSLEKLAGVATVGATALGNCKNKFVGAADTHTHTHTVQSK